MPELPEVESTVRYLRQRTLGDQIVAAEVLWERTIERPAARSFLSQLRGKRISDIWRRGKYVVLTLESRRGSTASYLFGHMRMSGSFDVVARESRERVTKHDRVLINLASGRQIRFHDPRKFGRLYLVEQIEEITGRLGVEPFDSNFSAATLYQLLCPRRGAVKPLLLNQSIIAGIGNIYADESLWRAKIHPQRLACSLTKLECRELYRAIRNVLRQALALHGTDNGDHVVEDGLYSPKVYGRTGEPCIRCSTTIERLVVGQRGTHICPRCQN